MQTQPSAEIQSLQAGDRKAFKDIFERYYESLCRYCMLRIGSREEAEEIVQDIFVKLWTKRSELNIHTSLRAYLYRTAMNKIINRNEHMQIRHIHQQYVKSDPDQVADSDLLHEKEIQFLAAETIESMPEKRRQVYLMSRQEGLKYIEIADRLTVSVKTVEAHLSKALEQLRASLKDYMTIWITISTFLTKYIG